MDCKNSVDPTRHMISGIPVPKVFVTKEQIDKLKNFPLRADDMWVVTYPKCGTTWTQQIVKLIRNGGKDDGKRVIDAVPWLEGIDSFQYSHIKVEELPIPRAFKSHFPYNLLPCGVPNTTPCKYVYVARNPKDVAVSTFFQNQAIYQQDLDWNDHWRDYIDGKIDFGNYFDHVLSWWVHKDDDNVLFMTYEDMKSDLPAVVGTIAKFFGYDLSKELIQEIADKTTFDKMKQDPTANFSWSAHIRSKNATPFMRKGIIGDWKNFLSPEQSAEIDSICAECLAGTGLNFVYE